MIIWRYMSAPRSWSHKEYSCFDFPAHRFHLMNSEVVWVLVSSGTQVQPQIIPDPEYLPDYISVSQNYALDNCFWWVFSRFYQSLAAKNFVYSLNICNLESFLYIRLTVLVDDTVCLKVVCWKSFLICFRNLSTG